METCCTTRQKETPIFTSLVEYDQLLIPPALAQQNWVCPFEMDDQLKAGLSGPEDEKLLEVPRSILLSEIIPGIRPFADLKLMKKRLIMGGFCNPAWTMGLLRTDSDQERQNPEAILPLRLRRMFKAMKKPRSVLQWRFSFLAWSEVELSRFIRWVDLTTKIVPILDVTDSEEGQMILQPETSQFWHPIWSQMEDGRHGVE